MTEFLVAFVALSFSILVAPLAWVFINLLLATLLAGTVLVAFLVAVRP